MRSYRRDVVQNLADLSMSGDRGKARHTCGLASVSAYVTSLSPRNVLDASAILDSW